MNTDIRIKTSFPNHPKTKKLMKKLGPTAGWSLLKLWIFTAQNKPTGQLTNMSSSDIADVMEFKGNPRVLIISLLDCSSGADSMRSCPGCDICEKLNKTKRSGWLDKTSSGFYVIHDWEEHNSYAYNSPKRIARAKKGAASRIESLTKRRLTDCSKQNQAELVHESCQLKYGTSSAPAPSPSPSPLEGASVVSKTRVGNGDGKSVDAMGRALKVFN